jgi:hypothetical protein
MKAKFALGFLLALPLALSAQSTTVSSTGIVDTPDGITWAGGTYAITFVGSGLSPAAYTWTGGSLVGNTSFTGSLNGSGAFSVSIPSNALITPSGSQWNIQICPNATSGCFTIQTAVSGSTMNLTTTLNAAAASPRFAANPIAYGYNTEEVVSTVKIGSIFYNVTSAASPTCSQWSGSAWVGCGGASSGGTVTSVTFTGDGVVDSSTPSSAVTTSGTVTATIKTQTANTVLAGPTSGSAAASAFRALVTADLPTGIPNANLANASTTVNGQTCTLGSTCTIATGLTQIAQVVVSGSSTTTVTFSAIPGTYSSLQLIASGAASDSGTLISVNCQFNSDATSTDYGGNYIYGTNAAVSAGASTPTSTGDNCFDLPGTSTIANVAGQSSILFPGYAGTVFYKTFTANGNVQSSTTFATGLSNLTISGMWKSTAAITSIVLTDAGGGHFIAGSTFTLYGMQ